MHEPGVVRAFIDAGMAHGWVPEEAPFRIDGWPLFEEVLRLRRAKVGA